MDTEDNTGSYLTTLKMRIFREPIAYAKGESILYENGTIYRKSFNQNDPSTWDEVLFDHQDILRMVFL